MALHPSLWLCQGSAAAVQHPRPCAAGIFESGFRITFRGLANDFWFAIFQNQTQWATEGHRRRKHTLTWQTAIGAVCIRRPLINGPPDLIVVTALAAAEFVNRHVRRRKKRGLVKPAPISSGEVGVTIRLAGYPAQRYPSESPRSHRRWGYQQCH